MHTIEQPLTTFAVNECFESIEDELREMLYAHSTPVGGTTLTHLRTLVELTTSNAMKLRQAAQSLQSFLEHRLNKVPITYDRNQIVLLLDSLRRQIRPAADDAFKELALLGKTAPYLPYLKQPACLFLDSKATTLLLNEVVTTSGHCVENICGLPNVVVHAGNDLPLTIIADLSTLRDDPQARDNIQRLRKIHPKTQVFCLSSATHFAARLEAVRLGASRFLIKQFDIDKLIVILDGVTARKETKPFRALLLDNGRALTALHAHAIRTAARNGETRNAALYPDVIVNDVYMTGCRGLQLATALYAPVSAARNTEECSV